MEPMGLDEALRLARSYPPLNTPLARAFHVLADEAERLRAIERRVQAASVAGVDAIVRDAALHMLNYPGA